MNCTFCGEPAIGPCSRKRPAWTIIQPGELQKDDLIMRHDGRTYSVLRVTEKDDAFHVQTKQKTRFLIFYPELPILVKREIECGWPRCEFHCGKCMRHAEEEERRAELLQSANAVNSQEAKEREEEHQQKREHDKPKIRRVK